MDYKNKIKNIKESCEIININDDAFAFISSLIANNFTNSHNPRDLIIIVENDQEIVRTTKQLNFFFDSKNQANKPEIISFYPWDCSPYDRISPKQLLSNNRVKNLYKISNSDTSKQFIAVTSIDAVMQKIINPKIVKNCAFYARTGSKIVIDDIAKFLVFNGYSRQISANGAGEFAIRGSIVDIVTSTASDVVGWRLDFFGDHLESIKAFDIQTQLSLESIKEISILPASEVILNQETITNFRQQYRELFGAVSEDQLYNAISEGRQYPGMEHYLPLFYRQELVSFFDYFKKPVIFLNNKLTDIAKQRDEMIKQSFDARKQDIKLNRSSSVNNYHPLEPKHLYFSADEFNQIIDRAAKEENDKSLIRFNNNQLEDTKHKRIIDLEIKGIPDFILAARANKKDPIEMMKEFLSLIIENKKLNNHLNNHLAIIYPKIIFCCLSEGFEERLTKLMIDYNIGCQKIDNLLEIEHIKKDKMAVCVMPINLGFYSNDLVFIGEQSLFGEKIYRQKNTVKNSQRLLEESLAINIGELVVHRNHGIGKFDGIHTITAGGIKNDFLKIIYNNGDSLFVPVEDINLITRYGSDNPLIQLDRLGGNNWKNRQNKVRKRIKIAASALIKIAATRHLKSAPILIAQDHPYQEFKARFEFSETDDQLSAIDDVEEDLRKGSPMDRLICGDVGFGKTEVAMRASFIAVKSEINLTNKNPLQVAIVTPTTLLCRQHYHSFTKRFAGSNIKIAQLSRLVSAKEAIKIKDDIENGNVDIVIGTHALLQKNIKFKNLGLLIIDEEQHFGVGQKERLKELKNEVHVLTLSATPIPRTLQMSLTGVKELSLISTPPIDRLAVKNFVMPYDSIITREAIMREYQRSGKIFFVVPRIKDIEEMEPKLKNLVPEIRITHAHGQMSPVQLDKIMNDFYDDKIDLLLSTTIIESGIDIASANTIIIYKAEMFGLSQLYQLRGRVGRGKIRGYAYFMLNNRKKISEENKKKLEVMQNLDNLGVGFSIASYDMDIRGSGNLLSEEQSGHIKETGVELYQQLLVETIESLKNNPDLKNLNQIDNELEFDDNQDLVTQIKLAVPLLIPEAYMPDLSLRMSFYKKIAAISSKEQQDQLKITMIDRFGKLPAEINNLIEVAFLKSLCKKLMVEKLEATKDGILVSFRDNKFKNPDGLLKMVFSSNNKIRLHLGQKILFCKNITSDTDKIKSASEVLSCLQNLLD